MTEPKPTNKCATFRRDDVEFLLLYYLGRHGQFPNEDAVARYASLRGLEDVGNRVNRVRTALEHQIWEDSKC